MKEEKPKKECEHKWKALGTEGIVWKESMSTTVIAVIFCEKCGKIKEKKVY